MNESSPPMPVSPIPRSDEIGPLKVIVEHHSIHIADAGNIPINEQPPSIPQREEVAPKTAVSVPHHTYRVSSSPNPEGREFQPEIPTITREGSIEPAVAKSDAEHGGDLDISRSLKSIPQMEDTAGASQQSIQAATIPSFERPLEALTERSLESEDIHFVEEVSEHKVALALAPPTGQRATPLVSTPSETPSSSLSKEAGAPSKEQVSKVSSFLSSSPIVSKIEEDHEQLDTIMQVGVIAALPEFEFAKPNESLELKDTEPQDKTDYVTTEGAVERNPSAHTSAYSLEKATLVEGRTKAVQTSIQEAMPPMASGVEEGCSMTAQAIKDSLTSMANPTSDCPEGEQSPLGEDATSDQDFITIAVSKSPVFALQRTENDAGAEAPSTLERSMSSLLANSSLPEGSPGGQEPPVAVLSGTPRDQIELDSHLLVKEVPSSSPEDQLLPLDIDGAQMEARLVCMAPERANEQTQNNDQTAFDHYGVRTADSSVADGLFATGSLLTAYSPAGFGTPKEIVSHAGAKAMTSDPFKLPSIPLIESVPTAVAVENAEGSMYESDLGLDASTSSAPSDAPDDVVFFPPASAESEAATVNNPDPTELTPNEDRHLSSSSKAISPAVGSPLPTSEALLTAESSRTFTSPIQFEDIEKESWITLPESEASPITGPELNLTPIHAFATSTSINGTTQENQKPQPLDDSPASGMCDDYIATPEDSTDAMHTVEKVVEDTPASDAPYEEIGPFDKGIATPESERAESPDCLSDSIPPTCRALSPTREVSLINAVKDQSDSSSARQDFNRKDMPLHSEAAEELPGDRVEHHLEPAFSEESVGVTPALLSESDALRYDSPSQPLLDQTTESQVCSVADVSAVANDDFLGHASTGDPATTAPSRDLASSILQIERVNDASMSEAQPAQPVAEAGSTYHEAKADVSEARAAKRFPQTPSEFIPVHIASTVQLSITSKAPGLATELSESCPENSGPSAPIAASRTTTPSTIPRDDVASLPHLETVMGQRYPSKTDIDHETCALDGNGSSLTVDSASADGAKSLPQPSEPEDPAVVRPASRDVEQVVDDAVDAKDAARSAGPRAQQESRPEDMGTEVTPRDETVLSERLSEVDLRDGQTVNAASSPEALAADAIPPIDTPADEANAEVEIPLAKLAAESGAFVVAAASAAPAAVEEPQAPLSDVITAPANAVSLISETPPLEGLGNAQDVPSPAELPAQPPVVLSQPVPSTPNPNSGEGTWQLKEITWPDPRVGGERRTAKILVQDANGPCSLLALANILILRGSIHITPRSRQVVEYKYLSALIADFLISRPSDASSMSLESALSILPSMTQGLHIDVAFKDIWSFKGTGDAGELAIFQRCGVPLVHGWVADKDSAEFDAVTRAETYDGAQMAIVAGMELQDKESKTPQDISVIQDAHAVDAFISSTATQITYAGLFSLTSSLEQGSIVAFFRNSHLGVLYRRPPAPPSASTDPDDASDALLYQLVTDSSFANEPEVAWESLVDLDGSASAFVNGDFHRSTPGGGEYAGVSAAHAARATARRERGEVQAGTGSEDGDAASVSSFSLSCADTRVAGGVGEALTSRSAILQRKGEIRHGEGRAGERTLSKTASSWSLSGLIDLSFRLARILQAEEDQQSAQHLSAGEDRSRRSPATNAADSRQRNQSTASHLGYVNVPGGRNGTSSALNGRASMDQGRGEFASSAGRGKAARRPAELLKRQSGNGVGSGKKTKDSEEDKKKCLIM